MKTCSRCKRELPLDLFPVVKGKLFTYCRKCKNEYAREHRAANIERYREVWKNSNTREKRAEKRDIVYAHYGGRCVCCGESETMFLSLDHVNNDGNEHRRKYGGAGGDLVIFAYRRGFPTDLRLMCFNCNMGRHRNGGTCPHETERLEVGY